MEGKCVTAAFFRKDDSVSTVEFHSHKSFEIYRFHQGNCRYLINNRIYRLKPGDVILMNGLTLHCANPLPTEPYVRSVVQFSQEWIKPSLSILGMPELLDPFVKLNNFLLRPKDSASLGRIDELIKEITYLTSKHMNHSLYGFPSETKRFREGKVKMLLIELLIHLYEWSQCHISECISIESEKERQVERVVKWIDQHYSDNVTLNGIAAALNLSKYYISHSFKEVTGLTTMNYLMECRLNQAKYLLEMHPEKSITTIAFEVGFESCAHFSRFFHQKTGITPSDYCRHYSKSTN